MNNELQKIQRPAEIVAETSSFLKKGDQVLIKTFDPIDNLYLAYMGGAGIWIKKSLFKFSDE